MTNAALASQDKKFFGYFRGLLCKCLPLSIRKPNLCDHSYNVTSSVVTDNARKCHNEVVNTQISSTLASENEKFLAFIARNPPNRSNAVAYKKAVESAFARMIQQAENVKTYEQYLKFCQVCSEYEQHQHICVAFCSIYLKDMRLRRDVEALFLRAAQEYADLSESATVSVQLSLMAIMYLVCVILAEASIDFITTLSIEKYFTESLARVIVEGLSFYSIMYFPTNSDFVTSLHNKSANDTIYLTQKQKQDILFCQSDPNLLSRTEKKLIKNSLPYAHKKFNPDNILITKKYKRGGASNTESSYTIQDQNCYSIYLTENKYRRSKSVPLNLRSNNKLPLLTLFLKLEQKSLYYKRLQLMTRRSSLARSAKKCKLKYYKNQKPNHSTEESSQNSEERYSNSFMSNERNSARLWLTLRNSGAQDRVSSSNISNINDSGSDRALHSNIFNSDTEQSETLRSEIIQHFCNCLGRFMFGTLYGNIAALPQCQQKLFVIFSYLDETREINQVSIIIWVIYWIEAVAQCTSIFHLVATSTPLAMVFLKLLAKVVRFLQNDYHKSTLSKVYKTHTSFSKTPKSSSQKNLLDLPLDQTKYQSSSVFSTFKSFISCRTKFAGADDELLTTSNRNGVTKLHSRMDNFNIQEYIALTVPYILLKLVSYCSEHYYHEIPNTDRPSHKNLKLQEILQKRFKLPKDFDISNIPRGDIMTCKHPSLIAIRNSIRQVILLSSLVTQTVSKSSMSYLNYINLILVLENYSLTQPIVLKESLLVSHTFKESLRCSNCGKFLNHDTTKFRKRRSRKYPMICVNCSLVRYCSFYCERRLKDFHANWCDHSDHFG